MIRLHDKSFEVFIGAEEIASEVASLAKKLNTDYAGKRITFVVVLNGAFMFASDLIKLIEVPCEVSFVKVSSYNGTSSKGRVDELIGLTTDIKGHHVIVLEDIVDTGITMDKITKLLHTNDPASVEVMCLLFKPSAFKGKEKPTYTGFSIPDKFVVGYGLDYNELGRNLCEIYKIKED